MTETLIAPLTPEVRLSRAPDILMAEVGGETVLMSVENGSYYGLAETAQAIWLRLEHPATVADIAAAMCAAFDGEEDRITAETLSFLSKMLEKRLIKVN